jgi:voltage-gated potassium channel
MFGALVARTSGKGRVRLKQHIVICGWSSKGSEILQEIRGRRDEESQRRVVVLAPLSSNPTRDDLTTFVQGDPTEARDLMRAGIKQARTAIVLADNSYPDIDVEDMDSRTLITVLAIESLNPACYTCVEVVHSKNREHFNRTRADELVVSAHMTGALLAHSAVTRGLSRVVGDLLTFPSGDEFYWVPVPPSLTGNTFGSALSRIKEKSDSILVAIAADGGDYAINPPIDRLLKEGDRLLLIAKGQPTLA